MLQGHVIGSIWATRRLADLPSGALLEVEIDGGTRLVALDVLGSGVGERVLVATGSVASCYFSPDHPPIDALIVGSIDDAPTSDAPPAATTKRQRRRPS